ncbi:MAG TPA: rod shape-determining protein MreC [Sphingobacteriaceae bacterium]|nr:rod shape-determining protein MreC [Sphingobacteriaceae bacterium]
MRNLWMFISKYNAFFLFIIFFIISIMLVGRNNSYQKAAMVNTSNELVGQAYEKIDYFKSYLTLRSVNDSLVAENVRLRNQLKSSLTNDTVRQISVNDTITKQQYICIEARVVSNSIHQKNNYITINRGSKHGIAPGMGVICPSGIVGIVRDVSENYARIQSLLHSGTKISASIASTNAFGSLVWGEGNYDPQKAILLDIPNHVIVKTGEKVVTTGFSLFPAGLPIGKISRTGIKGGNNFLDIEVKLNTDFSTLQYVYVVNNLRSAEQQQLEGKIKADE